MVGKMDYHLRSLASCLAVVSVSAAMPAAAQTAAAATQAPAEADKKSSGEETGEIVVTARKMSESLQDVPDSVTAFSASTLESAGVRDVPGFVALTPNVTLRESFRQGQSYITVRGITTGQQGWSPVTYVVDGVPAGSNDSINTGALVGIERIEVLKGPQSALYGAGAIGGAINIITKEPGDELSGEVMIGYGRGDDRKLLGSISTPLGDKVGVRLDGYYHKADGLQKDQQGRGLNFDRTIDVRGRIIFDLDPVRLDIRAHHVDIRAGAAFQELLPAGPAGVALIDDFDNSPGLRRGIVGVEDRKLSEVSGKFELDLSFATLTAISAYSDLKQDLFGSTSWNQPPALSFCGPVGGPGQAPDCTQASTDNFRVFSQDLRLQSDGSGPLQWMVGASLLNRRVVNALTVGAGVAGPGGDIVTGPAPFLRRADVNKDRFRGVYAQLIYEITDRLELTGALRYDQNKYSTTQYTDLSRTTVVPVLGPDGRPIETQRAKDDAWQPKAQLSYRWSDDFMTYVTVAKGFRTGFFNTGNRTQAESTWNYEAGFKSNFWDNRIMVNLSAFHIDYSNQQFTTIIPTPPFRATSNIPKTKINGFELDTSARLTGDLNIGASIGITDSKVQSLPTKTRGPFTPKFTSNLYLEYEHEADSGWLFGGRFDYRHQSSQFLGRDNQFRIGAKDYMDLRAWVGLNGIKLTGYVRNLTNERQAFGFENVGFGHLRYNNNPRSYGAELSYKF